MVALSQVRVSVPIAAVPTPHPRVLPLPPRVLRRSNAKSPGMRMPWPQWWRKQPGTPTFSNSSGNKPGTSQPGLTKSHWRKSGTPSRLLSKPLTRGFSEYVSTVPPKHSDPILASMASLGSGPHSTREVASQMGKSTSQVSTQHNQLIKRGLCYAPAMAKSPSPCPCSINSSVGGYPYEHRAAREHWSDSDNLGELRARVGFPTTCHWKGRSGWRNSRPCWRI